MELWFKLAVTASVVALVICQGLQTSFADLKFLPEHRALLLRSLAAVLLLVPFAVFFVILTIQPARPVAIGLALFAASPAAPLMLFRISNVPGRGQYAASLHLILAVVSIVTVPLTIFLFSRGLRFAAEVGHSDVAVIVAKLILIPMLLGLAIRAAFPKFAGRAAVPLEKLGKFTLGLSLAFLIFKTYRFLAQLSFRSYLSMTGAIVISLLIGHLMAGRISSGERTVLALESAGRHPGLVLLIVALNAPRANAMPVLVPYLLVFLVLSTLYVYRNKLLSFPKNI
jgi:bile acid:Na+ symporter, BASS family